MAIIHEWREMGQIAFALELLKLLRLKDGKPEHIHHIQGRLSQIDTTEQEVVNELQRLATPPYGYVELLRGDELGRKVRITKAGLALLCTANPARNLRRTYRLKRLLLPTPP